jgi:cysteinyl-tRNA synthetase
MTIQLYDTMARAKRPFEPADPARVTMYVCGPTVYNHAHIGNFRAAVVFDVLYRVLRRRFGADAVVYARNFTDVDDKIIKASRETGEPIDTITKKYAEIYKAETAAFNNLTPTLEPRATAHIVEMMQVISRLIDAGAAYAAEGHVLFSVDKFDAYGALSGADRDEMLAGARVEVAPYKENPADFVLWKPSKEDEPGWNSPWGRGRPGWHIECSAMIERTLGETIDIHGGGQDLRFPHHENEIAQSSCANHGAPLARYWVHNGFLRMGKDKMSKSLGNVQLPRDLLQKWQGEVLRFALLSAHYRQPLEWTEDLISQAKKQLDRFYRVLGEAPDAPGVETPPAFVDVIEDDLNTPEAFAMLHELRETAAQASGDEKVAAISRLKAAGRLLGFFESDPVSWFTEGADGPTAEEIDALITERAEAKKSKNFARADEIRDKLAAADVILEDGPDGVKWRRR